MNPIMPSSDSSFPPAVVLYVSAREQQARGGLFNRECSSALRRRSAQDNVEAEDGMI
jgi:hypothetical protein